MGNLVSVIVPVYNMEPYLDRCIQSILTQSYPYFEVLLIDDGSSDNSGAICDQYAARDSRVHVVHKENGGVSSARNVGIKEMQGDYFLFLDADDLLEKNTLRICVDAINQKTSDVVVFGRCEFRNNEIVHTEQYPEQIITDMSDMVRQILEDRHIFGGGYPNKMWRRSSFVTSGDIPLFSDELFYVEDMEWVVRMLLKSRQAQIIEPVLYFYDLRDDSVSHNPSVSEKRLIGYHDSLAHILDALVDTPKLYARFAEIRYSELINSIIDARLKQQKNVYQTLFLHMKGKKRNLLIGKTIPLKIKMRLLLIIIWQFLR